MRMRSDMPFAMCSGTIDVALWWTKRQGTSALKRNRTGIQDWACDTYVPNARTAQGPLKLGS